jgi:hypothetical protein
MSKIRKEKWHLNPQEVARSASATCSGGRRKATQSRALDNRSKKYTLLHVPTGLEVSGEIPRGNYSRKEMNRLGEQLLQNLFNELEAKVAKKLRVPGHLG